CAVHYIQNISLSSLYTFSSDDMDGPVEDIGSRSCVTRFVKTLLSIMEHGVKPHSKHLTEYFAFLYEFAKMGEEEVEVLSEEEAEEEDEEEDILSLAEEKYRPAALEKMIALIALLVEQSRSERYNYLMKRLLFSVQNKSRLSLSLLSATQTSDSVPERHGSPDWRERLSLLVPAHQRWHQHQTDLQPHLQPLSL
ncbi:Ubiquitin carboxyl-terminal hydrolase 34, partial [Xenoophorus captivus]